MMGRPIRKMAWWMRGWLRRGHIRTALMSCDDTEVRYVRAGTVYQSWEAHHRDPLILYRAYRGRRGKPAVQLRSAHIWAPQNWTELKNNKTINQGDRKKIYLVVA